MSSLIQQYDVDAPHFDHTEELPKVMTKKHFVAVATKERYASRRPRKTTTGLLQHQDLLNPKPVRSSCY